MSLELKAVSKTFPGQRALNGVDLAVHYGEIHALVGQNGSGKSTLIKILSGYHQPDRGAEARLDGRPFALGSAKEAEDRGLRFVHQDLGLVLSLSTVENIMLGRPYPVRFPGRIAWRQVRAHARRAVAELGFDIDITLPVGALSLSERAGVAIARAVAGTEGQRSLVVLDEPTAALPPDEVNRLLEIIVRLRQAGHGVLLVSHHLDEVLRVADRISVLRDGSLVGSLLRSGVDHARLAEMIVGRVLAQEYASPEDRSPHQGQPARLEMRGVSGARIGRVDLEVRPGEVVGVAGITGSGRESFVPLLMGRLRHQGQVQVDGREIPPGNPSEAMRRGMAAIPGERAQYGNFPNFTVRENMTISDLNRFRQRGRISRRAERAEVESWIRRLGIVTTGSEAPITSLSGGNQQKVLVARALRLDPRLLVLDDPTQGIDIGARAQIHSIIEDCARDGMSVVVASTDSDELAWLCDRVLVFRGGVVAETLESGADLTGSAIDYAQLAVPVTARGGGT